VAEKGFQAFKADKSFYIPGWHNWFVHAVLQRFVPRRLAVLISALVLKPRS